MKQESVSDLIAMAKEIAKAEKELEIQKWVIVSIEGKDANGERKLLFSYDLPRELYERKEWIIRWRTAKLQCQHPKEIVSRYLSYYDKRFGNDKKITADLKTMAACKAQVTYHRRKLNEYIAWGKANNMFFNEDTDEQVKKAREKLDIKEASYWAAVERMKSKIKQIKSGNYDRTTD